ncbi:MAG TPA: class I SAM-dependent methyltransferase [Burkholderiaceae bacterium]|nr:class I SAM-dependent methyltransferase [Burkholderiaceae bacterium]
MNDLERFFRQNTGRLIHKWNHYFEIYDRHFARFRGQPVHIVEFGVSQGGSLSMWRDYFGPQAQLVGVDINPHCKRFEEPGIRIEVGDQEDRAFLRRLADNLPPIDILIDDGGHTMQQQICTFEELFPKVGPTGVYLIEDLHTSYWKEWGGGVRRKGSFIEYSKDFIDRIHAWHSKEPDKLAISEFTRTVHSLHYYDSVLVIEKRPMQSPTHERIGQSTIPDYHPPEPNWVERIKGRARGAR